MANALYRPEPSPPGRPGRFDRLPGWQVVAPHWTSLLLSLLACGMLLWTFQAGRDLGMADLLSKLSWARAQYSTGIAISRLAHGAPGYLILNDVWGTLSQWDGFGGDISHYPRNPNQGIARALALTLPETLTPASYLDDWGDDKGNADYFMLSFLLFGFNIQALYHFYFLILALSLAVFVVQFFRRPALLALAPLYLAAHHLAVITLQDDLVTSTVHDAHFLAAAAYLASMHLALLLIRPERLTLWSAAGLLVQLALVILVIDSRPSSIWLIYFPVGTFALWLLWSVARRELPAARLRFAVERGLIVLLILAAPKLLSAYHSAAFDRRYTESGIESHMVWHSLYMGLSVHPDAPTYGLVYTDATSYAAGYQYLMAHPELAQQLGIDTSGLTFNPHATQAWITGKGGVGFRDYEEIGKHNYLSFLAEHPRFVVESFLIYKPKYLIEQILWQAGLLSEWPAWVKIELAHSPPSRHHLDLLAIPAVLVVVLAAFLAVASGDTNRRGAWIALTLLLFLASLLPSIVVAPIYYELHVVFATVATLLYALGAAALVTVVLRLARRTRQRDGLPRWAPVVAPMAGVLAVLAVVLLVRPLYVAAAGPDSAPMPGRLTREAVRDQAGQLWLLTFDGSRHLLPDWETYLHYDGNPNLDAVRTIDDQAVKERSPRGLAPRVDQAPDLAPAPSDSTLSLDPRVSYGPVTLPRNSANVAHERPAKLSGGSHTAGLAVDGNTSGRPADASIAATSEHQAQPWWQVDLGRSRRISYVQVYRRTERCCAEPLNNLIMIVAEPLHNFIVFVSDKSFDSDDAQEIRQQADVDSYFVLGWAGTPTTIDVHRSARYVRVQRAHPSTLELAEVQVWNDPQAASAAP